MNASRFDLIVDELQKRRDIHAHRSNDRQRYALTVMIGGVATLAGFLTAAEHVGQGGGISGAFLHWLIPIFVIGIHAFDARYRQNSARAEELMQRVYEKQIETLVSGGSILNQNLILFRNDHIQFYSEKSKPAHWASTRFAHAIGHVPMFLIFVWSLMRIMSGPGVVPPLPFLRGSPEFDWAFRGAWCVTAIGLYIGVFQVSKWRRGCFHDARRKLEEMEIPLEHDATTPIVWKDGYDEAIRRVEEQCQSDKNQRITLNQVEQIKNDSSRQMPRGVGRKEESSPQPAGS